jgi:hypothetical protein
VPSANGYKLEVNGHTLVAYWRAPFFVLEIDREDRDEEPLLIHCEDIDHARSLYRCCSGETYMNCVVCEVYVGIAYCDGRPTFCSDSCEEATGTLEHLSAAAVLKRSGAGFPDKFVRGARCPTARRTESSLERPA